ncbi:cupin domain-containing protein [Cellulomonas sp. URHB0016]
MEPVTRTTLADHVVAGDTRLEHVEVRRIVMAPSVAAGPHVHNGPVFGVVESGSVDFQVEDGEVVRLEAGDVFYEPADTVVSKFDATEQGVTFLGWFPLPAAAHPEIRILP